MFIGDGPELPRVRAEAAGLASVVFTGACRTTRCPRASPRADIGVAPFDIGAHAPLSLGFYWSPLKIFEYMAAGLPVVAPAVDRIPSLVGDGREGLLVRSRRSPAALADALEHADRRRRCASGSDAAARERAVRDYSWTAHCRGARTPAHQTAARAARR